MTLSDSWNTPSSNPNNRRSSVNIKKMQILWGLALYFLITCIETEWEKVRQDIADYKLELKISVCMIVNFKF